MENTIILDEKYSIYWRWALAIFCLITLVFFMISKSMNDVVWSNYAMLASFISFSVSVFIIIKLYEGKKSIKVFTKQNRLAIHLFKKENLIHKDSYEIERVQSVNLVFSKISVPFLDIHLDRNDAYTFEIKLKEKDLSFYLFQFGGGVISVDSQSARRLFEFLKQNEIPVYQLADENG